MATIGTRLDTFLKLKFGSERGSLKRAAAALDMDPSALQKYLKDQLTPGNLMHAKLRELGCDIEWLMTGTYKTQEENEQVAKLREENSSLKSENDRLRSAISPEVVKLLLSGYPKKRASKK